MHPHLVDWFRNVHIHTDLKTVEKRWAAAKEYATTLSHAPVPRLLRLFLFAQPDPGEINWFTDALLKLDPEFPVANNTEQLRLMAGVVMVAAFKGSLPSANAFALGLRFVQMGGRAINPVQPEILAEGEKYLLSETERLRPAEFGRGRFSDVGSGISTRAAAAAAEGSQPTDGSPDQAVKVLRADQQYLAGEIRRLAEETGMLWWILTEYSLTLNSPTDDLTAPQYALVATAEAAARTQIVPPPLSANALITRALRTCKKSGKKQLVLADFLAVVDGTWRDAQLRQIGNIDFLYLVPVTAALLKLQEMGDAVQAAQVSAKLRPGTVVEHPPLPSRNCAFILL